MPLPSYFKQLFARFQVFKDFRRNLKKKNIQNTNASTENFFNVVSESVFALDCLVVCLFFVWCFVGGRGSCGVIVSGFFWHASSFRIN
jgi:hypothetical protein